MTINRTKLRAIITRLADGGMGSVEGVIASLKELGAVRNQHLGKTDMTPDETVEWYAGQILDVLEERAWFAVNSVINCVDKFCPAQKESL